MTRTILIRSSLALAALSGAAGALASVDTSPPPGGVYRLKPGIYVERGYDCASPPNVAIRQYDGRGIGTAHSRACRVRVLKRRGDRYTVSQSCIGAGEGPAPREVERQVVTVPDALTFTIDRGTDKATFRYCPIDALPKDLRASAVSPSR